MRRHHVLMIGVVVLALAAGIQFMPRGNERATMLMRDGRYEEAIRELVALHGERTPQILIDLYNANEKAGRTEDAIGYLKSYIRLRGGDVEALKLLESYYESGRQAGPRIEALAAVVAAAPSAENVRELLGQYRLYSRFAEEEKLLASLVESDFLAPEDMERIVDLRAVRGDFGGAADIAATAEIRGLASGNIRFKHVAFLIEAGRFQEAVARYFEWRRPGSRSFDSRLMKMLARSGPAPVLVDFARRVRGRTPAGDLRAAAALIDHGRSDAARVLLDRWALCLGHASPRLVRKYAALAAEIGDRATPMKHLLRLARASAEPSAVAELAQGIAANFGYAMLAPVRRQLTRGMLAERPVFAAELLLLEGNAEAARRFLLAADPSKMTAQEADQWAALLANVASEREVFAVLWRKWQSRSLPVRLHRVLAQQAQRLNYSREYMAIWTEMTAAARAKAGMSPG